ncbi:APC membrane recruitment protein 2-like [Chanos chanos]|uniref:APC membrane recruitment protein 2-like n=1 Tax=Chanos chanos TaxID=29144 RepID=A0A6J2WV70_CHACN|nr:APC membrane recruitment protein 2-like [Chanos chanos]
MDVQSESCEPPPCDPQPQGKIRKAFKLFGKRKPGSGVSSIFSVRSKGESGPKLSISRSKTLDGLTETPAPEAEPERVDLEQDGESQKEDQKEESTEKEPGSKISNLDATPARQSISSVTSAKSLSFLTLLRRSRKGGGGGERQAQTESHRPGRQRKGLKGLFGSVRWHRSEKEESEEAPPGPLLLASRSNSVEIIKEDLTLTPRPTPRALDGPESEEQPLTSQDSLPTKEGPGKVSESKPTSQPSSTSTSEPTNNRLSTLLSDISCILSFESLSGCGDIVADVEAEWVKASSRVEGAVRSAVIDEENEEKVSPTGISAKPAPPPITKPIVSSSSTPAPLTKPTPSPSTTKPILAPAATKPFSTAVTTSKPTPSVTTGGKPISPPTSASKPTPIATNKPAPKLETTIKLATSPKSKTGLVTAPTPETTQSAAQTTKPGPVSVSGQIDKSELAPASIKAVVSEPIPPPITKPPPPTVSPPYGPPQPKPQPATSPTPTTTEIGKPLTVTTQEPPKLVTSVATPKTSPMPTISPDLPLTTSSAPTSPPIPSPLVTTPAPIPTPTTAPSLAPSSKPPSAPAPTPVPYTKTPPAPVPPATSVSPPPPSPTPAPKSSPTILPSIAPPSVPAPSPPSPATSLPAPSPGLEKGQTPTPKKEEELENTSRIRGKDITSRVEVDNKDMQDVLHMQPPRAECFEVHLSHPPVAPQGPLAEKKSTAVKPAVLSKIPVSGGGKPGKLHAREVQPNGDLPTPVHEEESQQIILQDNICQDEAVSPTMVTHDHEDSAEIKLSPPLQPSSVHTSKGASSLPRDSKIPVKQGSAPMYHSVQGKAAAIRSKIPVSKVPVRRTSSKGASTATTAATRQFPEGRK